MNLIDRYLQWLTEHELENYAYPPATPETIAAFETAHDITLPKTLCELYLRLGGQDLWLVDLI